MRRIVIALLSATAMGAVSANAADLPVKAPPIKPQPVAYSWTGCYLGATAGGNWGRSRHDNSAAPITNTFDLSGVIVGGTLGCNYEFPLASGLWLVGLETDFSWTNKKGSATDIPPFNTAFSSETSEKWLGTVRGRYGIIFGPMHTELVYATGGFAYARADITVTGPATSASESQTRTGWTVGGGWEHKFTPTISAKIEYLYVDLGNADYFNPAPAGFANRAGGVRLYDHIVRVGANWQFWP